VRSRLNAWRVREIWVIPAMRSRLMAACTICLAMAVPSMS
jgi:hypothetical protein